RPRQTVLSGLPTGRMFCIHRTKQSCLTMLTCLNLCSAAFQNQHCAKKFWSAIQHNSSISPSLEHRPKASQTLKIIPRKDMKLIASVLTTVATLCAMPAVASDTWPTKQAVRIVVPYSAGGSYDAVARELAQHFGNTFNQSFIVENRPGAGGTVGTTHVARSAPDGYTLIFSGNASFANNELLYKNISYSGEKDFAPIAMISLAP